MPRHTIMKIVAAALIMGAAFFMLWDSHLLTKIPGFACESFGCIGLGLLYGALALILPALLALSVFLLSRQRRGQNFLTALLAGYGVMALVFVLMQQRLEAHVAQGYQDKQAACAQYPQLCP